VDSKADCDQLNLAHVARKKNLKKKNRGNKNKQTPVPFLVQYRFKICEGSPEGIRMTMEERICERHEF